MNLDKISKIQYIEAKTSMALTFRHYYDVGFFAVSACFLRECHLTLGQATELLSNWQEKMI